MNTYKFAFLTLAFFISFTVFAQFSGGNGSEGNPYIITTSSELAQLATYVNEGNSNYNNKYYKLGNNLDISDYGENYNDGKGWIPIGIYISENNNKPFKGFFDGDDKIISSLYINNTLLQEVGLFAYIENGTVKNLGVENVNIYSATVSVYSDVGSIVGYNKSGNVLNCYSTGSVCANPYNGISYVGGIAGYNSGNISNCYSDCSISSTSISSYSAYAGGIVGYNNSYNAKVSNCYSTGSVSAFANVSFAGGVVGRNQDGLILNCAALNSRINCESSYNFGRVVGNGGYLENNIAFIDMLNPYNNTTWYNIGSSYPDGDDITAIAIYTDCTLGGRFKSENGWKIENGKLPGLFGNEVDIPEHILPKPPIITILTLPFGEVGVSYNKTLTASNSPVTWSLESGSLPYGLGLSEQGIISGIPTIEGTYNFTVKATNLIGFDTKEFTIIIFSLFNPDGNGTENSPYIITTPEQLAQLALYINRSQEPYANYSVHYKLENNLDLSNYGENYNDGEGWIPIGKEYFTFKGIFDGNNKVITNLFINNTTLFSTGLFGEIDYGTVKNLGVENVNIDSKRFFSSSGGIIGFISDGKVSNCYSTGFINSSYSSGGIVGVGYNSDILNCYSESNVNSYIVEYESYAGGVIGYAVSRCNISNCYSTGTISACNSNLSLIGGIIGMAKLNYNYKVSNCVALNPILISTTLYSYFGRVAGLSETNGSLENNIAFIDMLNLDGNVVWENKGLDQIDGEDISFETIYADGSLGGRFTSENGWTVVNGKLPGLFGKSVNLPGHLCAFPIINTENLQDGKIGVEYSQTLSAYGTIPITWSLESGYLPKGLDISTDGIISGIPTATGVYYFTVKAANPAGYDTIDLSITINPVSGISDNSVVQTLNAYMQNDMLYINGLIPGEKWFIYDLSGRLIYSDVETSVKRSKFLQSGIYVLKSGNRSSKVIVK